MRHLLETFPQLAGVRIGHAWGGVIDTCTRFCCFWGTAHARAGWRTRWGSPGSGWRRPASPPTPRSTWSTVCETERTGLQMVREKPVPFPPEPLRWAGIEATRRSMERADRTGRDNLWLRTMDRLGLGFDS